MDVQFIIINGNYFFDGLDEGNGCVNCLGGVQYVDWFYYDVFVNGSIFISSCLNDVNIWFWVYIGFCGNFILIDNSDDDCVIS